MDVICLEACGGAAPAEDREVALAAVAGSGKERPPLNLTEPAHHVVGTAAVDDSADAARTEGLTRL